MEKTGYKSVGGQAQYLCGERLDIRFSTKEALREGDKPRRSSQEKIKRVGRYLLYAPRYVINFYWQRPQRVVKVLVDSDHAGCPRTRKSTSCILVMRGRHLLNEIILTQPNVAISSGESEFHGLVRAAVEACYVKNVYEFLDKIVMVEIVADSTAALGAARRLGCGKKMKHIGPE